MVGNGESVLFMVDTITNIIEKGENDRNMKTVFVILWRYDDRSSCGVLRAYADYQRAQEDLDLLELGNSGKEFSIEELPVYFDGVKNG